MALLSAAPSIAFSADGYDGINCTVIIGKKLVKLEPSLQGTSECIYRSNDAPFKFVMVKLNGEFNIYDKAKKSFLLKNWVSREPSLSVNNGEPKADYRFIPIEVSGQSQIIFIDRKTGEESVIIKSNYLHGPFGDGDREFYAVNAMNDLNSTCKFIKIKGKQSYEVIFESDFKNCSVYGSPVSSVIELVNESTQEHFTYKIDNLVAAPKVKVDENALKAKCGHLYKGKSFSAPGGALKIQQEYVVVGFSAGNSKATIKSPDTGYTQEVDCINIP